MNLDERFKKFPIKFYKTKDGIYYENSFIQGKAKDLNDAFNQLKEKNLDFDLYYYYDDVTDLKVGSYEPALTDKNTSKGQYIGQLNLELELDDFDSEHSVKYLSKNPDKIKDHEKFIKKLKDKKKRDKFFNDLKLGIKKVASFFQPQYEMFSPYKTRDDLICDHCGDIIPTGSYYEYWQGKNYHIECIWDKLTNDKKSNEHLLSTEYFLSLQKLLNNWPGNLDCIDDYVSDLNLYKINKRLGLTESAAMEKAENMAFDQFYSWCKNNKNSKDKLFFEVEGTKIRIPSDTILHDLKRHDISLEQWNDCITNINNIENCCESKKRVNNTDTYLLRILGLKDYGLTITQGKMDYIYINTIFTDHPNTIDNWINNYDTGKDKKQIINLLKQKF